MISLDGTKHPGHPGLNDLVLQLLSHRLQGTRGAPETPNSWLQCGAWGFRAGTLSGTITAEVCTSLLSAYGYVSDTVQRDIETCVLRVMPALLEYTSGRDRNASQLQNFVRPLEAYALYVQLFGHKPGELGHVRKIAENFFAYEQGANEARCFRNEILNPEQLRDAGSYVDLVIEESWQDMTIQYNGQLASCWLAYIGCKALQRLSRLEEEGRYNTGDSLSSRMKRNDTCFSRPINKGVEQRHDGACVFRLFLAAEESVPRRNDTLST